MKTLNRLGSLMAAVAASLTFSPDVRAELSESRAREYLNRGARVVDVRTVEEFNARSLTNAVNIPLAQVKQKFPTLVTNQSEVVLLHCRTGRRSGIAEKELRELGYTNVFNIGSLERARKISAGGSR